MENNEDAPLLGQKHRSQKPNVQQYFLRNIEAQYAYVPLLICCFVTGLIDAGSYNAWGVFMGMQTGNTIFLALSTANLPAGSDSFKWARCAISIISLILGSMATGWIYAAVGATRRLTLVLSFLLQTLLIATAAILVHTDTVPETNPTDARVLIAIPLLAAQSGAQIVTAKSLGFNELPTTVLTSVYNDLGGDINLLKWDNPKRNRRLGAVAMMLLGGISAGWLLRTSGSLVAVLWAGAAIKLVLSLSWLVFSSESSA